MLTTDEGKSVPVKYGTLGNVKYNNGLVSQAKDYRWDLTHLYLFQFPQKIIPALQLAD